MRPLLWCNLFNRLNLNFRQNLLILLCLDYDNNTVLLAYFLSHSNSQTEYITDVQGYIYIPWCRWSLYCQSPKQLLEPVTFGSDDVDHLMNGHGPGIEGQRHFPFSRCSVPSNQALVYVCVVSYSFIVALTAWYSSRLLTTARCPPSLAQWPKASCHVIDVSITVYVDSP